MGDEIRQPSDLVSSEDDYSGGCICGLCDF